MTDRSRETEQERAKRGEDNLRLCRIATYATKQRELLQRTEDFLRDSGEEDLSERFKLWRMNCEALHVENMFFVSYGLITGPVNQKVDQVFWDQATRYFAGDLMDETRDTLKLCKMLNITPLTPYEGWESDVAHLSERIETYQPLTLARVDIVNETQDVLRRVDGTGLAAAFDNFAMEIGRLRAGAAAPTPLPGASGPNPALP